MLTPQKKITPMKNIKRPYNGTPLKYKDNLEFAERMLSEFKKNTDTLDLTNCELQDEEIVQIV